jgi:hypothetical protein
MFGHPMVPLDLQGPGLYAALKYLALQTHLERVNNLWGIRREGYKNHERQQHHCRGDALARAVHGCHL